jgi:hypothetical protein
MKHRRLVNIHTTGRFAGMAHIHGVEQGATPFTDAEMPSPVEIQLLDGRFRTCQMVRTTERTVFYREDA